MIKYHKDYIEVFRSESQLTILEMLYETTWIFTFSPDGEIETMVRYLDRAGGPHHYYHDIDEVPDTQKDIVADVAALWKKHLAESLTKGHSLTAQVA
jgi:hypothetical protein